MIRFIKASKYIICVGLFSYIVSSCDNFFNTAPHDAITPATFWKTEQDADAALTACYNWWFDQCTGPNYIFLMIVCQIYLSTVQVHLVTNKLLQEN